MSIKTTDEIVASTVKGKVVSARQVFLDGDKENVQQVADRTSQLEQTIKDISASGGASMASAVSYDNTASGMTAVSAQAAIDELSGRHVLLSEAEYNALEVKDSSKIYMIYEE